MNNDKIQAGQVYASMVLNKKSGKKSFALLIDPDKVNNRDTAHLARLASDAKVDYLFVGGSLSVRNNLDNCVCVLKEHCNIPIILFPGNASQVSRHADALLYLSLISGRNADLLIGQHVVSAPFVKQSKVEIMPTGYILIDGGLPTSVSYMSNSAPVPFDKEDIAACTAMAGEMLGLKLIFMDAGSGAQRTVSESMIAKVALAVSVPLIVGGGINTPEKIFQNCAAGADIIVVGNAIEKDRSLIREMAAAVQTATTCT